MERGLKLFMIQKIREKPVRLMADQRCLHQRYQRANPYQNDIGSQILNPQVKMNKLLTVLIVAVLTGCNRANIKTNVMENKKNKTENTQSASDTIPKVTGIGGIFFFSDNPKETKAWYAKNLGLEVTEWGSSFEFRNANRPNEINCLQWSPFKTGSEYFLPSKKEFMINYRVRNIEGLAKKLKANGFTVIDEIEAYDYGKFVHIMDAEGNKIELWEPIDSVFPAMGGKTTK
jgi:predicted enzyme related to lactoylglutathione lyase